MPTIQPLRNFGTAELNEVLYMTGRIVQLNEKGKVIFEKMTDSSPDKMFDNTEEAALFLEEAGCVINEGKIKRGSSKVFLSDQERRIVLWLIENGYEWIGTESELAEPKKPNGILEDFKGKSRYF
jgi:hypothetical protein